MTTSPDAPGGLRLSPSLRGLGLVFPEYNTPTAGEVVAELLRTHGRQGPDPYLDGAAATTSATADLEQHGVRRALSAHLAMARDAWDPSVPELHGRHLILALALEDLGGPLLETGVVAAMLALWRPGKPPEEPYRLVWDALSDSGRRQAEDQPLLAAAFGAPPEVSVAVPPGAKSLAWSPRGDRLAVLTDVEILEVQLPAGTTQRIGPAPPGARSLGWGSQGVVVLSVTQGQVTVSRASDGTGIDTMDAFDGVLSGDGSQAWLATSAGVVRRTLGTGSTQPITAPRQGEGVVLAVNHSGARGILRLKEGTALVTAVVPPTPRPGSPNWPPDAAPLLGWAPMSASSYAPLELGGLLSAAMTSAGLELRMIAGDAPQVDRSEGGLLLARLATGRAEVTALAADPTGTRLAAAVDGRVDVWSLRYRRAPMTAQPDFDNDRPGQTPDLLETSRDAQAIAALVSSRDLHPPLSIGLFGDWGSGKSFLLRQIKAILAEERPDGFLRHLRIVEFNAWQYAESNLWASLVDAVLRRIGPLRDPEPSAEVVDARTRAAQAEADAASESAEVAEAEAALAAAKTALVSRRQRAGVLVGAALLLLAAAIVAVIWGVLPEVSAAAAAALSLVTLGLGALRDAKQAGKNVGEAADAITAGAGAVSRLLGRPESEAVRLRAAELAKHDERRTDADALATERRADADQVETLAVEEPLQALLHGLAQVNEYRDQLSMVSRVHDHFEAIDAAVRVTRARREAAAADGGPVGSPDTEPPAAPTTELDRVVVIIDDLDRCPPEKVVNVLEAVHLLFGFEMFVVIIAVDTRWLEQSLRIRYRQLLGRADSASPTDYLEKILQVPIHIPRLDADRVRRMIAGLTVEPAGSDAPDEVNDAGTVADVAPDAEPAPPAPDDLLWLTPTVARRPPRSLPAEVLRVSPDESAALSEVADLVGTTPRTVKRFVNTFRLLKAGSALPEQFGAAAYDGGPGDHEVVAFLLATLIGRPYAAPSVLSALRTAASTTSVVDAVRACQPPDPALDPPNARQRPTQLEEAARQRDQVVTIVGWLDTHPRYASAPAGRFSAWIPETSRYSFTRLDATTPR